MNLGGTTMCCNCNNFSKPTIFKHCGYCQDNYSQYSNQSYSYSQNGWGQECGNSYSESGNFNCHCGCPKQQCKPKREDTFKVKFEGIIRFC